MSILSIRSLSNRCSSTFESYSTLIEELTDEELVHAVENLRVNNQRLDLENEIYYNYLLKMEPRLLQGMAKVLNMATKMAQSTLPALQSQLSISVSRQVESVSSFQSNISNMSKMMSSSIMGSMRGSVSGQRINFHMRTELIKREKDLTEEMISTFYKQSKTRRVNLKAEVEETSLQLSEVLEARDLFEQSVVKEGIDPLTQRIPAEKFARYMDEWLKSADSVIEKLRLRTSTLHYKFINLRHQLAQKLELGETLHPVDFDQMKIENKKLIKQIEQKNIHLLELKKTTGAANLVLSKHKRFLQKQMKEEKIAEGNIKDYQMKIVDLGKESVVVNEEVEKSRQKLDGITKLIDNYTVPDLLDYVRTKRDLHNLKNSVRIWSRRNALQKNALNSCIKTMKRLTGKKDESESWFQFKAEKDDDSLMEYPVNLIPVTEEKIITEEKLS